MVSHWAHSHDPSSERWKGVDLEDFLKFGEEWEGQLGQLGCG